MRLHRSDFLRELSLSCQHQRTFNLQPFCGGKTFLSRLKGRRLLFSSRMFNLFFKILNRKSVCKCFKSSFLVVSKRFVTLSERCRCVNARVLHTAPVCSFFTGGLLNIHLCL